MFKQIQNWFNSQWEINAQTDQALNIELATAVLLYEVMRADRQFTEVEQESYRNQLSQHFTLSKIELEHLCEMSQVQAEEAVDFQKFTKTLNDLCEPLQKRAILDSLWTIAYADHVLAPDEEYTIRKIAELLYIPHSQFIQSKLAVQENNS
ncbi:TerB family tellurite resistance protein [Flavobacterium sp. W21_SRS_FM6]|uniref:tellurite resistance TerB family protein n=1 Tax=Flavobacterium sp. W21_SRS_FM6 TaxID=3240268 RepID=UPI003F938B41